LHHFSLRDNQKSFYRVDVATLFFIPPAPKTLFAKSPCTAELSARSDVLSVLPDSGAAGGWQREAPLSITLDGYAASHWAVREMPAEDMIWYDTKMRSSKYLNNMIEHDHLGIKSRIAPMLGFKIFKRAAATIAGIELLHRSRKGQFDLGRFGIQGQAALAIWAAVLAA
jgi:hypothetical protein